MLRSAIMADFELEMALEKERHDSGFNFAVGICPKDLNGNHQAWCHTVEWFATRQERDDRAMELEFMLHDSCNTTHCWEDSFLPSKPLNTRTAPRVR